MADDDIEYTLLNKKECMLYQIPPASATGHKASDWLKCIWRGRLLISAKGNDLYIKFIHASGNDMGKSFVEALVSNGESDKYVERTQDSSRYFAIRVNDPTSGRKAFLGLGFEDRNDAFDFNCTLTDFKNRNQVSIQQADPTPSKDYSLKEGEKITVNFKGVKSRPKKEQPASGQLLGFLPPPPSGSSRRQDGTAPLIAPPTSAVSVAAPPAASSIPDDDDDDFFSDFQSFQTAAPTAAPLSFQTTPAPIFQSTDVAASTFQDAPAVLGVIPGVVLSTNAAPMAPTATATYTGAPMPASAPSIDPFSAFEGLTAAPPAAPPLAPAVPIIDGQPAAAATQIKIDDPFDIFN
eukprot:GEMP01070083.1.p1 GENE.GEMP01070083.1~~GEMP01070083.1.p1  ORF type:complete len:350 (-),score=63.52 GEMP01070083.1:38-1087(-)